MKNETIYPVQQPGHLARNCTPVAVPVRVANLTSMTLMMHSSTAGHIPFKRIPWGQGAHHTEILINQFPISPECYLWHTPVAASTEGYQNQESNDDTLF